MLALRLLARVQGVVGGVFLARGAHQRAQRLDVGLGNEREQVREGVFVLEQLFAHGFEPVHGTGFVARPVFPGVQLLADLVCGRVAHQLADIGGSAPLALARVGPLRIAHGVKQPFADGKLLQAIRRQGNDFGAQVEQRMHLALDLGLAWSVVIGRFIILRVGVVEFWFHDYGGQADRTWL